MGTATGTLDPIPWIHYIFGSSEFFPIAVALKRRGIPPEIEG
jgi:hypothetical protein